MTRGKALKLTERSRGTRSGSGDEKLTKRGKQPEKKALSLSASKAPSLEGGEALTQIARRRA